MNPIVYLFLILTVSFFLILNCVFAYNNYGSGNRVKHLFLAMRDDPLSVSILLVFSVFAGLVQVLIIIGGCLLFPQLSESVWSNLNGLTHY